MGSKTIVSLLFHVIIVSITLTGAEVCYNTGNFTANSTYAKNRDLVLRSLASNVTNNGGFYNTTIGLGNDTVYGLVLCMASPSAENCSRCVSSAIQTLTAGCPNQKEAISWGGNPLPCIVHYANRYFLGSLEQSPNSILYNVGILDATFRQFEQFWSGLGETVKNASTGSSRLMPAVETADLPSNQKAYVFMQCTPDVSPSNCSVCLQQSVNDYKSCCYGHQGGIVQKPNCVFRWDLYPIYDLFPQVTSPPPSPSPSPSPPSPSPSPPFVISSPPPTNTTIRKGKENTASRTVIVTIVPTAIFLALVILILTIFCFRKPKQEVKNFDEISITKCWEFKFATIKLATNDFSDDNKLGQGGFGAVYKGILADGQAIAVKRLSSNSGQGEVEFKNEVRLLAKLDHRNLVRLLGFCLEGTEKLLIYEFVPNSSLDQFIHDPNKRFILDWEKRYKIIEGIARGILYLHQDSQLRIIHRDLKPSNILLDGKMNAKISDFGMAKLMKTDQTHDAASRIAGTFGYIAPEYARQRQFSVKSDVFSFGVLVLEIVSGQKPSFRDGDDIEHLTSHAWRRWREGTALDLIDPILRNDSTAAMMTCIHIGLLCVQENVADRPTMASVVLMLSNSSFTLQIPSKPAFFISRRTYRPASSSTSYTSRMTQSHLKTVPPSKNEISITELDPR
ncbi:cysteine-rich receptor-like protein kinase 44 isoform X27 [Populus trichocarpa]|uniref:cysteine-rich receptor-like protein kinase 44 isoform X27 n=1 Tax=Populus trichocarpa TaxID=3694 RepID=UPI00227777FB|nr:cysteine-rich receptor-like protein kinase 44 isoform X27 [Populus trichocarpa]